MLNSNFGGILKICQLTERDVFDKVYFDFSKTLGKVFAVLLDEMVKARYKQKYNIWVIF